MTEHSDLVERLNSFLSRRSGMMSVADEKLVRETVDAIERLTKERDEAREIARYWRGSDNTDFPWERPTKAPEQK